MRVFCHDSLTRDWLERKRYFAHFRLALMSGWCVCANPMTCTIQNIHARARCTRCLTMKVGVDEIGLFVAMGQFAIGQGYVNLLRMSAIVFLI